MYMYICVDMCGGKKTNDAMRSNPKTELEVGKERRNSSKYGEIVLLIVLCVTVYKSIGYHLFLR